MYSEKSFCILGHQIPKPVEFQCLPQKQPRLSVSCRRSHMKLVNHMKTNVCFSLLTVKTFQASIDVQAPMIPFPGSPTQIKPGTRYCLSASFTYFYNYHYFYCGKTYIFAILIIFRVHCSVALGTFTLLCNHHSHFQNFFLIPNRNSVPVKCQLLISCSPSLITTTLLSLSINLPILSTSCQWNHTIFVLLCLAYFSQHKVFKINPYHGMCQNFLPF